jgi:hypothetical protein
VLHLISVLQDWLKKLLCEAWEDPATFHQQPSMLDLLHLAANMQRPNAADALLNFLQEQRLQLQTIKHQLEMQSKQQQRKISTRNRARSELQQHDLQLQLQHLQQHLQEFDQEAQGLELEQLLATTVARGHGLLLERLCKLPAAAQLPGDAILQLLHRGIVHRSPSARVTSRLLRLAADADAAAEVKAITKEAEAAVHEDDDVAGARRDDQQKQQQPQEKQEQRQLLLSGPAAQQQLERLLFAAVTRGNSSAVALLVEQRVLQAVDSTTCSSLASIAIQQQNSSTLSALLKLPGLQDLPVQEVEQLLTAAVTLRNRPLVQQIAGLPNAAAVSPATLTQLLSSTLQGGNGSAVAQQLLALPTALSISSDGAAQLAEAALAAGTPVSASWHMQYVCRLPAAAHIAPAALSQLLATAIQVDSMAGAGAVGTGSAAQLCSLTPAALGLAASDVAHLLQTAAELGNTAALAMICSLPAASQLQADDVYAVLQAAIATCRPAASTTVREVCMLLADAVSQLQRQQMHELLAKSVSLVNIGMGTAVLSTLLQLPAAQQLQVQDASALVWLALQVQRSYQIVERFLDMLPAAQQMEAAQLAAHAKAALSTDRMQDAAALLNLQAAHAIEAEDIAALLLVLFSHLHANTNFCTIDEIHVFNHLLDLPKAHQLQPQRLVQILQELLRVSARLQQLPRSSHPILMWVEQLTELQAAAQIPAADVEQLLQAALQHQHAAAITALSLLEGAQQLNSTAVFRLLTTAISAAPVPAQQQTGTPANDSFSGSQIVVVGRLCKLPGAQAMLPEQFSALLYRTLHLGRPEVLKTLSQAGGPAEKIEKRVLLDLLRTAVQRMTGKV